MSTSAPTSAHLGPHIQGHTGQALLNTQESIVRIVHRPDGTVSPSGVSKRAVCFVLNAQGQRSFLAFDVPEMSGSINNVSIVN